MIKLAAQIEGIGLLGPGMDSWTSSIALLNGRSQYIRQPTVVTVPDGLPPAERRRVGLVVKLALGVGMQAVAKAGVDPDSLPAVFASSGGDGQNCHEICDALSLSEPLISPTRFHNSVHNAAAGYWSIATRSKAASNALCAFDVTFAAGLLEAITQVVVDQTRVLLVAYDVQYPPPLFAKRPIPDAFGVAFVLAPDARATAAVGADARAGANASASSSTDAGAGGSAGGSARAGTNASSPARITVQLSEAPADRMANPDLESLRASIPAARSLPLLRHLALRKPGVVNVEYLDGKSLAVEIEPCT